jgi:hypothetical protein
MRPVRQTVNSQPQGLTSQDARGVVVFAAPSEQVRARSLRKSTEKATRQLGGRSSSHDVQGSLKPHYFSTMLCFWCVIFVGLALLAFTFWMK